MIEWLMIEWLMIEWLMIEWLMIEWLTEGSMANQPNVPFGRNKVGQMVQTWQAFQKSKSQVPSAAAPTTTVVQQVASPVVIRGQSPVTVAQSGNTYTVSVDDTEAVWTRITLTAPPAIASPVGPYRLTADFFAQGQFDDENLISNLTAQNPGVVIARDESLCTNSIAAWTVQIVTGFTGMTGYGYNTALIFNPPSLKGTGWTGASADTTQVAAIWTVESISGL